MYGSMSGSDRGVLNEEYFLKILIEAGSWINEVFSNLERNFLKLFPSGVSSSFLFSTSSKKSFGWNSAISSKILSALLSLSFNGRMKV